MIEVLANAMGLAITDPVFWMPLVFLGLFFLVVLAGTILDGFDIGVGSLSLIAPAALRPRMLSLLSPWRDANEYWLFLGMVLFFCAFPHAWEAVMGSLYLPLCGLALGVLLRSVSFEMRLRAPAELQAKWQVAFGVGSVITAFVHGVLLAKVVVSFNTGAGYFWFSIFMGLCSVAAYALLGASWLIMREAGELRARAVRWGSVTVRWFAAGAIAASVVLALANPGVLLKWSEGLQRVLVLLLWGALLLCFISLEMCLQRMINSSYRTTALPFMLTLIVFVAVMSGLAFSFFPFLVLDEITIWDGAASLPVLQIVGGVAVLIIPIMLLFNIWVYKGMFGLSKPPQPPEFRG